MLSQLRTPRISSASLLSRQVPKTVLRVTSRRLRTTALANSATETKEAASKDVPPPWPRLFPRLLHPFELQHHHITMPKIGERVLHEIEETLKGSPEDVCDDSSQIWSAADIKDFPNKYELEMDCPGMLPSDLDVSVHDTVVQVSGCRHRDQASPEGFKWTRLERSYGSFDRRFKLPSCANGEGVTAKLEHGVLHVNIPKHAGEEAAPIHVAVQEE